MLFISTFSFVWSTFFRANRIQTFHKLSTLRNCQNDLRFWEIRLPFSLFKSSGKSHSGDKRQNIHLHVTLLTLFYVLAFALSLSSVVCHCLLGHFVCGWTPPQKVSSSSVVWSNCFRWMLTASSSTRGHSVGVLSTCLTFSWSLWPSSLLTCSKCSDLVPVSVPSHPCRAVNGSRSLDRSFARLAPAHTCALPLIVYLVLAQLILLLSCCISSNLGCDCFFFHLFTSWFLWVPDWCVRMKNTHIEICRWFYWFFLESCSWLFFLLVWIVF